MTKTFTPNFYIGRPKEISRIHSELEKNNIVAITGVSGVGKTVLAKLYAKEYENRFDIINYLPASEVIEKLPNDNKPFLRYKSDQLLLTIVDGIDEIDADMKRINLVNYFAESASASHKIIYTYRSYIDPFGNKFKIKVEEITGFTKNQASLLFESLIGTEKFSNIPSEKLDDVFSIVANSPWGIYLIAEMFRAGIDISEMRNHLYTSGDYAPPVLDASFESKIILPETSKIICDVQLVNASLIDKVNKQPNLMYSMTSRQFEEFVAELFQKEGYNVSLTQATRDGGKDMFIAENRRLGNFIYYVECKKYLPTRPVGVSLVRELYGTIMRDRATAGLLVTSSSFTKDAIQFTESIKTQMSLKDFIDLKEWIADISKT